MKFLVDNCLSRSVAARLEAEGHDVVSVADWPRDPGDRNVLAFAAREDRVLVTADRGFGELVVTARLPNAGLIILTKMAPSEHPEATVRAIAEHGDDLMSGAFLIITGERTRARVPDADA